MTAGWHRYEHSEANSLLTLAIMAHNQCLHQCDNCINHNGSLHQVQQNWQACLLSLLDEHTQSAILLNMLSCTHSVLCISQLILSCHSWTYSVKSSYMLVPWQYWPILYWKFINAPQVRAFAEHDHDWLLQITRYALSLNGQSLYHMNGYYQY